MTLCGIHWRKNLADGKSIICDTNINHPLALQHFSRIQQNTNARIVVLECFCRDEEEHRRRLDSRKQMNLSSFWIDSWEKYQEYLKSDDNQGDYEIPYQVIRIDTSQPIELPELVAQIFRMRVRKSDHGPNESWPGKLVNCMKPRR